MTRLVPASTYQRLSCGSTRTMCGPSVGIPLPIQRMKLPSGLNSRIGSCPRLSTKMWPFESSAVPTTSPMFMVSGSLMKFSTTWKESCGIACRCSCAAAPLSALNPIASAADAASTALFRSTNIVSSDRCIISKNTPTPTLPAKRQRATGSFEEIVVAQLCLRVGEGALRHATGDAHFRKADTDRLGIEHLHARRRRQVLRIDYVGNQRAAERHDDLGSGLRHQSADGLGRDGENFLTALRNIGAVDADRPDVADEVIKTVGSQQSPRIGNMRRQRHGDADAIGERRRRMQRGAHEPDHRNIDRKAPAIDARLKRVRGDDRVVAVFGGPEDLPHDGRRLH